MEPRCTADRQSLTESWVRFFGARGSRLFLYFRRSKELAQFLGPRELGSFRQFRMSDRGSLFMIEATSCPGFPRYARMVTHLYYQQKAGCQLHKSFWILEARPSFDGPIFLPGAEDRVVRLGRI